MTESLRSGPSASGRHAFRILGPLQVTGPDGPVRIPPGRQEVIFAALLLEANRVVGTDYLVDLIWEDEPPDTARTQVQICVSRLRKVFARSRVDAQITTRPPGYVLSTEPDSLDMTVFNRQLAEARVLVKEGRDGEAADLLRAADALWEGPCLSGLTGETLRSKAHQLDEERLTALETRLQLELDLGRHHQLVGEVQRLVREHPLRERLRGLLMLALYRSGRQAEALDSYRAGRELLIDELGLDPGEDLRLLETAILSGDAALRPGTGQPPRADTASGSPAAPAETSETAKTSEAAEAADTSHREEKPRQLPADTADFIADEQVIRDIEAVVAGGEAHRAMGVAVIVGKPGIGKSTLATHLAHRLSRTSFPDGQLYCDLRGAGSVPATTAEVLGRFLRALGIPGPVIPDALDERAEMYRTLLATRRLLVVLDDAASEAQISALLPGSSSCAVLVTSRARLTGLPGAHRVELDVLGGAQALELLGRILGVERVANEREAADALVRTVGGLPLALRIVAARLAARPHWSLASMVHRLANERHRLDELTHGEMTMRASLSLTHDGLPPSDQQLLRLLSLAGGVTLPGWLAGALLDDDRPYPSDLLEPLVDMQMLDVVGVESIGGFRYGFHEIIRVFAREQLALHDSPAVQSAATQRMLGGWMSLAEQAHRRIYGGDYTLLHGTAPRWAPPAACTDELLADPVEWLDSEHANLTQAVEHAAREQLDEVCWNLATTLVTLFEARGYLDLWERTHRTALGAVQLAGNKRGCAAVLGSLGSLHLTRRQHQESSDTLGSALELFTELDDAQGLALCRRDLALLARLHGNDDEALELYARSLRDFDRAEDIVGRATVLTQRAHIWMRRGQGVTAQTQLDEALAIYRSVGYEGGLARAMRRVGQVLLQRGDHEQAEQTLTEVLRLCRHSGDVIGEGQLLRDIGQVHAVRGRYGEARSFFDRALSVREQIMDHGGAAVIRLDLARLLGRMGEGTGARDLLEEAAFTFRDRNMSPEWQETQALLESLLSDGGPGGSGPYVAGPAGERRAGSGAGLSPAG
ncbi:BTAD domain-containing putative transcriptional regulator [Streptomyces sp. ACA25]|uniref:AfsR/SARP family transcriptional regulator n=1 Tax=Streptomyces sp. ACA25 TaxID=3022596 RepID=UPI00230775D1|nr:AfsR/SARP family transcriptional regulator [Streptomyces sp. ACA25]MDB1090208.1 BTAD domain-containing putative transcriptional regulator [Streptomyces sp. ACA25]